MFYDVEGKESLSILWRRTTRAEVTFRGNRGDQAQQGSAVIRVRDVAHGTRSQIGAGGGAVALLVELMSCHIALPGSAPLSMLVPTGRSWGSSVGVQKSTKGSPPDC